MNVSKGQTAKDSDLKASFGTTDINAVILEILHKGELQVGSEERGQHLQMMSREVATIVAEKCVNPRTKTPYPVSIIQQAMAELHFSPNLMKNAKQQALEVIKLLEQRQDKLPISRAQMRLLVTLPSGGESQGEENIRKMLATVEEERREEGEVRITCLIDPGHFRQLSETVNRGRGSVLLISLKDVKDSA